ncbi:MAG: CRTAC1 family protein [Bryobacteraceae bacterium]|nr:CRTAC1 family protein [Bryobacteraceae bacterium]
MTRACATSAALLAAAAASLLWVPRGPAAAPSPPPPRPVFRDIASPWPFRYVSNNSLYGRKWFPQPMCGGIAVLDYDNDGLLDIFFTNGARFPERRRTDPSFYNLLLRQKPGGSFEDVTERAGLLGKDLDFNFGVAAGDYDNDGWTDLFLATAGRNVLYRNMGNGTFRDVTAASGIGTKPPNLLSVAAAWFDYDRDGWLDLFVSNYTFWSPETDHRCAMSDKDLYCDPRRYPSVPHQLFRNLGNGRFADVTARVGLDQTPGKGMGVSIADFNGDGWLDVFVANDTDPNFLFLNRQGRRFDELGLQLGVAYNENAQAGSSMGCDAKDYDNDGLVDIFYNNLRSQIWGLLRNTGQAFELVSTPARITWLSRPYSGWSSGFIDYNNDGWKDIYSSNGDVDEFNELSPQNDTMFENVEGRHFIDVSAELGPDFMQKGFQRGSAFADLNNDGWMDIIVTSLNRRPRILLNGGLPDRHWLLVELTGRRSPRDAIGAAVKVTTAGGRTLYNHVAVSVGFMGSSDRRVHFGLGAETRLRSVEITWPSGLKQTLTNVAADQILKVAEPAPPRPAGAKPKPAPAR